MAKFNISAVCLVLGLTLCVSVRAGDLKALVENAGQATGISAAGITSMYNILNTMKPPPGVKLDSDALTQGWTIVKPQWMGTASAGDQANADPFIKELDKQLRPMFT